VSGYTLGKRPGRYLRNCIEQGRDGAPSRLILNSIRIPGIDGIWGGVASRRGRILAARAAERAGGGNLRARAIGSERVADQEGNTALHDGAQCFRVQHFGAHFRESARLVI
jgi:hypothetical protein